MKKTALFLILFLYILPAYSQSGWYWQNPTPQGNVLYDVSFFDLYNGWAVGDFGTILYTSTQGQTWVPQFSGTRVELYDLYFNMEDDGWAVGENGTILHWDGFSWEEKNSGTHLQLHGVHFISSLTGWAVGQNQIVLHTSDGGTTWEQLGFEGTEHYFSVYFIDENRGYLAGAAGSNGVIKSTSDGGLTWDIEIIPAKRMNSLCLAGSHTLWAVGDEGAIFYKANSDSDWIIQDCGSSKKLNSVSAINPNQVWVCGEGGIIYHSENHGTDWLPENSTVDLDLHAIHILDGESGWAAGDAGSLVHTQNLGGTWTSQHKTGPTGILRDISVKYPEWGLVVGDSGVIYSSRDGGENWIEDTSGVEEDLYAVDIAYQGRSYNAAYAVGYGGVILLGNVLRESTEKLWRLREYDHNEDLYGVDVRGSTVWIAGHFGSIALKESDGIDFQILHQDMGYHLYDIHFASRLSGYAVGMSSSILCTRNRGVDWEEQSSPVNAIFWSVFASYGFAWAVGSNGTILFTDNFGYTWTEQNSGTNEMLTSVYFTDLNNGWIVGDRGCILNTKNGGETWRKQASPTTNLLWSVNFADPVHGWICGDKGTILATIDGGGGTRYELVPGYDLGKPILDMEHTYDTISVEMAPGTKAEAGSIKVVGLEVLIDTILHSSPSDLEITLSHQGVIDTLVFHQGSNVENFLDLKLSDAADMPIDSGVSPFQGSYRPFKPLSAFAGLDPEGDWVLDIYDAESGNSGTLDAWSLLLYTGEIDESTSIKTLESDVEKGIALLQNYPNPFKDQTTISYWVDGTVEVELGIYNMLGQVVGSFPKAPSSPGEHRLEWNPKSLRSGVYIVRLRSGSFTAYRKILLVD
jgi:photosystem II stability/assembly factor-like uncharacterized protein